jgi:hypothetical protein
MLPAASTATAGVGIASKGIAMAKSGSMAAWLAPLAPFVGIFAGVMANWLSVRSAPTVRERRFQTSAFIGLWAFVLAWAVGGQIALLNLHDRLAWSDQSFYAVMTAFWWFYATVAATFTVTFFRRIVAIRRQSEKTAGTRETDGTPLTLGSNLAMTAGVYVALFSWLIYIAWRANDLVTAGIIGGIMTVLGIWNFLATHRRPEQAGLPTTIRHLALAWAFVLAILNLRLDMWLAAFRGVDLAEIHRLLPVWVVPVATLTLLIWTGVLVALTTPQPPASQNEPGRNTRGVR